MGKKRCSRCGAEVTYIRGEDGRNIMVDARPIWVKTVDGGRIDVYGASGKKKLVRRADRTERGAWLGYRPHAKTCTNPITVREIREREAARPITRRPAAKNEPIRRAAEPPRADAITLF